MTFKRSSLTLLAAATALISIGAQAEGKISIAQQFGIGYLILDVVPGRGGMFSLENGREKRFHIRSRLFSDAENRALDGACKL